MSSTGEGRRLAVTGVAVILTLIAGLAGCDDPVFEPIREGDFHFSIFGYLDASADTQWVRVTPPRREILGAPDPIEAIVTLEDVEDEAQVVLNDSLTRFVGGPFEELSETFVRTFWTTADVEPGGTYRLRATRPDGEMSAATVSIPEEFRVVVSYPSRPPPAAPPRVAHVQVEGVEHLAFVNIRHHMPSDCRDWTGIPHFYPVPFEPSSVDTESHEINVSLTVGVELPCGVVERDIFVVGSGEEWPAGVEFSPNALGVLDQTANLENAVGFFGGTLSRAISWDPCFMEPGEAECSLTFDAQSVTLEGKVTDAGCEGPLAAAEVRLAEVLDPGVPARVRTTSTDSLGTYRIQGLEGGVSYALSLSHPSRESPGSNEPAFEVHEETVVFEAGESAISDVALQRTSGC